MKTLHETRLLDYYDGPSVIEAQDEDGRRYLCDLLDLSEDGERFIVTPVSDEVVGQLNEGETCLQCAMKSDGGDEWYLSVPQWDFQEPFEIERQRGPISKSPYLPGPDYKLTGAWDD